MFSNYAEMRPLRVMAVQTCNPISREAHRAGLDTEVPFVHRFLQVNAPSQAGEAEGIQSE